MSEEVSGGDETSEQSTRAMCSVVSAVITAFCIFSRFLAFSGWLLMDCRNRKEQPGNVIICFGKPVAETEVFNREKINGKWHKICLDCRILSRDLLVAVYAICYSSR